METSKMQQEAPQESTRIPLLDWPNSSSQSLTALPLTSEEGAGPEPTAPRVLFLHYLLCTLLIRDCNAKSWLLPQHLPCLSSQTADSWGKSCLHHADLELSRDCLQPAVSSTR